MVIIIVAFPWTDGTIVNGWKGVTINGVVLDDTEGVTSTGNNMVVV